MFICADNTSISEPLKTTLFYDRIHLLPVLLLLGGTEGTPLRRTMRAHSANRGG